MTWDSVKAEFEWDGSWRDVYVRDTTVEDWERILAALHSWTPTPSFRIDGEIRPWPFLAKDVFDLADVGSALLEVQAEPIQLNCHFFGTDEIEFDVDPREVTGAAAFKFLVAFMTLLAEATGKAAILTPENQRDLPFFTVEP